MAATPEDQLAAINAFYELRAIVWRLAFGKEPVDSKKYHGALATIPWRGSIGDLATDIAYELTPDQVRDLIETLEGFFKSAPHKFKPEPPKFDKERETLP